LPHHLLANDNKRFCTVTGVIIIDLFCELFYARPHNSDSYKTDDQNKIILVKKREKKVFSEFYFQNMTKDNVDLSIISTQTRCKWGLQKDWNFQKKLKSISFLMMAIYG